ncbi:MAG: DegQ family serine endoprotease [Magnetococcales bacterium]|nr:DegQ family serine endoprotease [Magnetococcales bacterium]
MNKTAKKILVNNCSVFVAVFTLLILFPLGLHATTFPELVPLIKKLKPVVVNISITQTASNKKSRELLGGLRNSPFEEFFRQFLDKIPEESFTSRSLGSGVLIDSKGYIVTNNHVVSDADEIMVRLFDEREFSAKVVGRDKKTDLALIQIDADGGLPVAKLGDSDSAEVGSWVVAIGNPFGLEATVTAGIISATGRMIGNGPYDDFLQTDAAINPGNSGGPLFNLDGEVIGINTAIMSRSGGSMGIGFAIPINMARSVIKQLKENGKVTRGWLGVRIQTVTPELAAALGMKQKHGALVASVEPDSPAEKSGILAGDVIVRFDGRKVHRMKELPGVVAKVPVGKSVPMQIFRDGQLKTIRVVVAVLDDTESGGGRTSNKPRENKLSAIGLTVQPLLPAMLEQLNVPKKTKGVVVSDVDKGGIGAESGIRPGDVIIEIDRKAVRSMSDFNSATKKLKPGSTLLILLLRGGDPHFMAVQIPNK